MAIIVTSILFVILNIFFFLKIYYEIQDLRRESIRLLQQISLITERVEKKMYECESEINYIQRSFQQSQSEIFKWQEALQNQLNKAKSHKQK